MKTKVSTIGIIVGLFSVLGHASYSVFAKILLEYFEPHSLTIVAQLFAVLSILFFWGTMPELKKIKKLSRKRLGAMLAIAFLSAVCMPLLIFKGLQDTTATTTVLLACLGSVFSGIIAAFWLKEKITFNQIMGALVMFGGVYIIVSAGFQQKISFNGGEKFIVMAMFCSALSLNVFKKYLPKIDAEEVIFMRNIIGVLILLVFFTFIHPLPHQIPTLNEILDFQFLIFFGLFAFGAVLLSQYLWYRALELISSTTASTLNMAQPLFGVVLSVLILKENLEYFHFYGGGLVMMGLFLTLWHHKSHPHHRRHQRLRLWLHA